MGISDDGPYILMAQTLASTGRIVYNGWAAAMIGWQLYIGAAFIKLFGFSFTAVRMSTLLVSLAAALSNAAWSVAASPNAMRRSPHWLLLCLRSTSCSPSLT